jgi:hypothetical protein
VPLRDGASGVLTRARSPILVRVRRLSDARGAARYVRANDVSFQDP